MFTHFSHQDTSVCQCVYLIQQSLLVISAIDLSCHRLIATADSKRAKLLSVGLVQVRHIKHSSLESLQQVATRLAGQAIMQHKARQSVLEGLAKVLQS